MKTIEKESLTDIIEQQIYAYLKDNDFKPGDSFPKEIELAEMLQTSRPVVREALSRLRMLGLITSRKRRGMQIAVPDVFGTMNKIIDPAFLGEKEKQDFYGLRVIIELGLADVLAFAVSDRDIELLEGIVCEEEKDPSDFGLYRDCDYRFHMQVYRATRCAALESFETLLYRKFTGTPDSMVSRGVAKRFEDPNQSTHRDILEAVKTKIPDVIRAEIHKHMFAPLEQYKRVLMLDDGAEQ